MVAVADPPPCRVFLERSCSSHVDVLSGRQCSASARTNNWTVIRAAPSQLDDSPPKTKLWEIVNAGLMGFETIKHFSVIKCEDSEASMNTFQCSGPVSIHLLKIFEVDRSWILY